MICFTLILLFCVAYKYIWIIDFISLLTTVTLSIYLLKNYKNIVINKGIILLALLLPLINYLAYNFTNNNINVDINFINELNNCSSMFDAIQLFSDFAKDFYYIVLFIINNFLTTLSLLFSSFLQVAICFNNNIKIKSKKHLKKYIENIIKNWQLPLIFQIISIFLCLLFVYVKGM